MGDANSPTAQRDHRVVFQRLSMLPDDLGDEGDPLVCGDIRQAQEPGVGDFPEVDQFAEISVDGNENPVFGLRKFQQCPVPWILTQRASFTDIVPLLAERLCHLAPSATVNQKPHDSPTVIGASVSREMIACA